MAERKPGGLERRGRLLWSEVTEAHDLARPELVLLEDACRIADRLDRLDAALAGRSECFREVQSKDGERVSLVVDSILAESRQQANVLKQLVAALRLPDEGGKRASKVGSRGAYKASGKSASVSSLDRARQRAGA